MTIDRITRLAARHPWIVGAKHFVLDRDVSAFVVRLVEEEAEQAVAVDPGAPMLAPSSARLPCCDVVILTGEGFLGGAVWALVRAAGSVLVAMLDEADMYGCGSYTPGGSINFSGGSSPDLERQSAALIAVSVMAMAVALINEPRVIRAHPEGSRQQRRAAQRGMGFAVDAWHRVSWDLSKETLAKISRDPDFHKVPLHWRRGHYRRAEPHFRGAHQRPDALRPEDRDLWWQWIEGQWVGHPAFGTKIAYHAPRISTGALARRRERLSA